MKSRIFDLIFIVILLSPISAQSQNDELFFTILHTNDEHSAILPHSPTIDFDRELRDPTIGGFARLSSAVNEIRMQKIQNAEPVILVSAGDFSGGTPFAWLMAEGYSLELILMQKIGYDVITLGNHEFDFKTEKLIACLINAGYPKANEKTAIVATNFLVEERNLLKDIFKKVHLIQLENGLKIGFIGIIGKDAQRKTYSHESIKFEDPIQSAKKAVKVLQEQGADVIIAISHSGISEDFELAKNVPEIDIIVGAHCHSSLEKPLITPHGTIIVQAGHSLQYLGVLELAFNRESGKLRIRNNETSTPFLVKIDDRFAIDPDVDSMIKEYTKKLNELIGERTNGRYTNIFDVVLISDFELTTLKFSESNIGNFITDAMRIVVEKKLGEKVDFALFANGEIRGNITPGTMKHSKGRISLCDLLIPVSLGVGNDGSPGYSLVSVYITGKEIHRLLEIAVLLQEIYGDDFFIQFSGLRYYYNPNNALISIPLFEKKIPTILLPFGG
ncbi:MAG: bifunctional metallophosphatase/5'-nucleotidase, partial [Archaeoglobaceae archaeon]|nr:bifunctional metallophosphatase/5'-nucleotidase [Archaeoglobaceae archaeon]